MAAARVAAAALQYSKQLSKFICWAWILYRFTVLLAAAIQPSIASAIANTIPGMDTIMLVNVSTYMVNSLGEKIIYSDRTVLRWLDKGGFKYLLGKLSSNIISDENEEEEETTNEDNG